MNRKYKLRTDDSLAVISGDRPTSLFFVVFPANLHELYFLVLRDKEIFSPVTYKFATVHGRIEIDTSPLVHERYPAPVERTARRIALSCVLFSKKREQKRRVFRIVDLHSFLRAEASCGGYHNLALSVRSFCLYGAEKICNIPRRERCQKERNKQSDNHNFSFSQKNTLYIRNSCSGYYTLSSGNRCCGENFFGTQRKKSGKTTQYRSNATRKRCEECLRLRSRA